MSAAMDEPPLENSVTTDSKNLFYISDLDGTLLNHEGQLPKDSINRLNRLITRGLNLTIATRPQLRLGLSQS